jgi:hypothetical protein
MPPRKFTDTEKWCPRCESWLPYASFGPNSHTASGLRVYCLQCEWEMKGNSGERPDSLPPKSHCRNGHEFTPENTSIVHVTIKGEVHTWRRCKTCCGITSKRFRERNPQKCTDSDLRKRLGIGLEDKSAMLSAQHNRCAACGDSDPHDKKRGWHTDHDHATGEVRGVLCRYCNLALGQSHDDPDLLRKLADYLDSFSKDGESRG